MSYSTLIKKYIAEQTKPIAERDIKKIAHLEREIKVLEAAQERSTKDNPKYFGGSNSLCIK